MKGFSERSVAVPEDGAMKREKNLQLAVHDYQKALKTAVSWLGDRYLLAEPVRRREEPAKVWFAEPRSWHPATRH